MADLAVHRGGCHCGAVKFAFDAPRRVVVQDCNCSICAKTGFLHLIVPGSRFRLLTPREAPVLPTLRHQVVLRPALEPRWV